MAHRIKGSAAYVAPHSDMARLSSALERLAERQDTQEFRRVFEALRTEISAVLVN